VEELLPVEDIVTLGCAAGFQVIAVSGRRSSGASSASAPKATTARARCNS
jgi:hypothetical protein